MANYINFLAKPKPKPILLSDYHLAELQVTSLAIRVMQDCGHLAHEWVPSFPEPNTNDVKSPESITMAALNEDGVIIASTKMLYAVTVDDKGVCHVVRTRFQDHEVL